MPSAEKEITPVIYNCAALKLLHFSRENPGDECFRMHWHERMELHMIRRGVIWMDFGTFQEKVGPGNLVIIHPNQLHHGICAEAPLEYDTIMFDARSFLNETEICRDFILALQDGRTSFLPHTDCPQVLTAVETILSSGGDGLQALRAAAGIYQLIFALYENCLQDIAPSGPFDRVTRKITGYMEAHYQEKLTTEALCARFGYSKSYFCHQFRQHTGLTPMAYLNIFRVEKAYGLLKSGQMGIREASEACGFPDANYFTRAFKRHFGHPPSFYLKK